MRGPFLTSMATRLPDGSIDVETWNTHKGGQKAHWTRRAPFIRGIFNMVDSMVVGYSCLMKSAEKAGVEEEPTKFDRWLEEKLGDNMMKVLGGFAVVLGVALAAVLWLAAHHGGTGRTAVLRYGDPQVEQRIDLRKNAEYDIDTGLYTIHLRVENGGIAFVDSPCPDHLCEGFGTLKNEGDWAACMPAKASVTIE